MADFTLEKYRELWRTLNTSEVFKVGSYCEEKPTSGFVILRHDIDRKPLNALKMAELESKLGVQSTYYFRYPYTFKPEIIEKIHELGHEIGYHYEVLSKAGGDYEKAIKLFEYELNEFRKIIDIKTICMHGNPLSKHDNRDLWKRYDFRDFGIIGEAYLSIKNVNYFSDTGRSWNWKNKIRDFMLNQKENIAVNTTNDLIRLIKSKKLSNFYVLVHPERWSSNKVEWAFSYMKDFAFNIGKEGLATTRNRY